MSLFKFVRLRSRLVCVRNLHPLSSASTRIDPTPCPKDKLDSLNGVPFGTQFTDHMLTIEWDSQHGFHPPVIGPFRNLSLHPAASSLHYSLQLFEGMKAYRSVRTGQVNLFRPWKNMNRLNRSAERVALPAVDGRELVHCIAQLVKMDEDFVPHSRAESLYIRPTYISTQPTLGVAAPNHALLYCLLSPVGPYFKTGAFNPVTLMADPAFVRSWYGGSGNFKLGGNYGPTIPIQKVAEDRQCQQVLWLYDHDFKLTEVGTMNVFIEWTNKRGVRELITPPLNQLILPGVTRDSILEMARGWNEYPVHEREVTMSDLVEALEEGRLHEMFGAGTACVVCPINGIHFHKTPRKVLNLEIPFNEETSLAKRIYNELTGIQFDEVDSPWTVTVDSILQGDDLLLQEMAALHQSA